jgi:hypothetical protein
LFPLTKVNEFDQISNFCYESDNKNKNPTFQLRQVAMRGFRKIITEMRLDNSRATLVALLAMLVVLTLYISLIA